MRIRHLALKNWRNFKSVEIDVSDRPFGVGDPGGVHRVRPSRLISGVEQAPQLLTTPHSPSIPRPNPLTAWLAGGG